MLSLLKFVLEGVLWLFFFVLFFCVQALNFSMANDQKWFIDFKNKLSSLFGENSSGAILFGMVFASSFVLASLVTIGLLTYFNL